MVESRGASPNESRQPDGAKSATEHLLEFLLTGTAAPNSPDEIAGLAERILRFDARNTRAVILGGGTGLSTIAGGNSQLPDWPAQSDVGLKREFDVLDFVVCTTDDGGSTGKLLQTLPMIGIGDLRKLLLSSMRSEKLASAYGVRGQRLHQTLCVVHRLFNFRFTRENADFACYQNPLLLVSPELRAACPKPLSDSLARLGTYVSPSGPGPTIPPQGHALGNIFLASAIFMAAEGRTDRPPTMSQIRAGIRRIADIIGTPAGGIHAATATPGQLKFRYANGVEVYGQSKSAQAKRSSPVERVTAEFHRRPVVGAAILDAVSKADLILYAPGSLYTSIIPILQLDGIVDAIRANRSALKILGANFWVQEGETDRSLRNRHRGFLVSELIEAYGRNISGGICGLFDIVLSANMEHIPGNILRNYALEGKSPIHLDRLPVLATGVLPVEATLFSADNHAGSRLIHHDPRKFALAVRTLLFIDRFLGHRKKYRLRASTQAGRNRRRQSRPPARPHRTPLLCRYMESIRTALDCKEIHPPELREHLLEIVWENRDIPASHFDFFRGVRLIPAGRWHRSTELDNVLGYFDPRDRYIKLRKDLLKNPSRLQEDFLIALGESLLGRYIKKRRWIEQNEYRRYEITLERPAERECRLTDSQLRTFLALARMAADPDDGFIFRITLNRDEGFLPPGLLFGLVYAWYLSGKGFTMEYEMTLLRWPQRSLIPMHAKERVRKEALVTFFRKEIFGHSPD